MILGVLFRWSIALWADEAIPLSGGGECLKEKALDFREVRCGIGPCENALAPENSS